MLKKFFLLTVFLFAVCLWHLHGQASNPRAQKIIDDMTAQFKAHPSLSLNFTVTVAERQNDTETTHQGRIWIKNEKYKLETSEYVIYFDGSMIYQYMPAVNEVYLTKADPTYKDDDFQLLNPQTYFNISSANFRTHLLREFSHENRLVSEIDLIPVDVVNMRYSRIRLMVEQRTLQLVNLKVFMKDGTNYILEFRPYGILQTALRDNFFVFDARQHPQVEVIDLTF